MPVSTSQAPARRVSTGCSARSRPTSNCCTSAAKTAGSPPKRGKRSRPSPCTARGRWTTRTVRAAEGSVVLVHSPRAATRFAELAEAQGVDKTAVAVAAISADAAAAVGRRLGRARDSPTRPPTRRCWPLRNACATTSTRDDRTDLSQGHELGRAAADRVRPGPRRSGGRDLGAGPLPAGGAVPRDRPAPPQPLMPQPGCADRAAHCAGAGRAAGGKRRDRPARGARRPGRECDAARRRLCRTRRRAGRRVRRPPGDRSRSGARLSRAAAGRPLRRRSISRRWRRSSPRRASRCG